MIEARESAKRRPTDRELAVFTLLSFVFMAFGGGIAWGLGGAFFGVGLWLLVATATESIERTIKDAHAVGSDTP